MNFPRSKRTVQPTIQTSVITSSVDENKTFDFNAVRRSLDLLQEVFKASHNEEKAQEVISWKLQLPQNSLDRPRLENCKTFICDTLKAPLVQKNYILQALANEYLSLDNAVSLLLKNSQRLSVYELAQLLNGSSHATGKYSLDINQCLKGLRIEKGGIKTGEILSLIGNMKEYQNKEALLIHIPVNEEGHEIEIYDIIKSLPAESHKYLMNRFFFNSNKTRDLNTLIKALKVSKTGFYNHIHALFSFLETVYKDQKELETKAWTIQEAGGSGYILPCVRRIPTGEKRIEYFAEKSPIDNFIPYMLFNKTEGAVAQELLTVEEAIELLRRLEANHPYNCFVEEAKRNFEKQYSVTV